MPCNRNSIKLESMRRSQVIITFLFALVFVHSVCGDRGSNVGCFRKAAPGVAGGGSMHLNIRADSVDTCIANCEKLFYRWVNI